MTRIVGSPRPHADDATSARACAYGTLSDDPCATSAPSVAVGAERQRQPRTAASKKSWVLPPPRATTQSAAAPGADSATAAARAEPSPRAAPASTPADLATATSASSAWPSVIVGGVVTTYPD